MAGFNFSPNTYAGQAAGQFMLAAITGADMINGGNLYIKETKSNKYVLPTWQHTYDQFVQDPAATPTPGAGTINVGERYLNLGEYLIYQEFNPQDYADHWFAKDMPELLLDRGLPVEANSVILYEIFRQNAKYLNKLINNGDTTLTSNMKYIDGLITKMAADSAVTKIGSPVALTNSNIVSAALDPLYSALPDALKFNPDVKFYMGYTDFAKFEEYQRNQTYKGIDVTRMGVPEYRGHKIEKIADLPENSIYVAKGLPTMESNLWMGVNSTSDENNIKLAPLQANSDLWFVKAKIKVDVNYVFPAEVVLYKY